MDRISERLRPLRQALRGRLVRAIAGGRSPLSLDPEAFGMVETFSERDLIGWLHVPEGEGARRIDLYLDDVHFASTYTSDEIERATPFPVRRFNLKLKEVWKFCTRRARIRVRHEGRDLLIAGHGFARVPPKRGKRGKAELARLLDEGHVFNQFGTLQLSKANDARWGERTMELYDRLNETFIEARGAPLSICYGTLLGAVRSGRFIGHDHDVDACFVCEAGDAEGAKAEMAALVREMARRGFDFQLKPSCVYLSHPDIPEASIDVFHLYFDDTGELQFPFGSASREPFTRDMFKGYTTIELEGRRVHAVDDPAEFVSRIYGAGWREPNPGFNWKRERVRQARDGRLTRDEILAVKENPLG